VTFPTTGEYDVGLTGVDETDAYFEVAARNADGCLGPH
jgi:hypothetical protein